MLNEALGNDVTELRDQTFVHEHLIELAFFGVNEEASDSLVQIIEYFLKVCRRLNQGVPDNDKIKDFEEAVDVAVRHFQGNHWTLDHEQGEAPFQQSFKENLLLVNLRQSSIFSCQGCDSRAQFNNIKLVERSCLIRRLLVSHNHVADL